MKFGEKLSNLLYPEWKYYYLDYDALKKLLKKGTAASGTLSEEDEANFVQKLEAELDKVAAFRNIKGDELNRRIQHTETVVRKLLASSSSTGNGEEATENPEDSEVVKKFTALEEELGVITVEVNELSKFTRLNYSGFMKIIKKHDKHTGYVLKPLFNVRLASRPFYKENFDSLIIRLSRLYDTIRTKGQRADNSANKNTAASQNFVRRTTKYWVHPDNVTEVKCIILKYLPVLVFGSKSNQEPNPAITSIYFDNDQFELYQGRLEKTEGAEAIRIRWYGGMEQNEIFVERKTHREDWTGESSVKSRFPVKEKYVNSFLKGDYNIDHQIQKMRERGQMSEKELENMKQLAGEVQETVLKRKLHPVVRTFYNRTAFQLPGDARVRISLDTELSMVREDNYDGVARCGVNWRRMDMGIDYPFSYLPSDDITRFPYAILEVKLQTQYGTEAPKWVDELVKSHLVEEVPKFSKFIHGVSTLLEKRVSLLPFWLPQMDKDIRKPAPEDYISPLTGKAPALANTDSLYASSPVTSTAGEMTLQQRKVNSMATSAQRQVASNGEVRISLDNTQQEQDEADENTPLLGVNGNQKGNKNVKWSKALTSWLKQSNGTSSSTVVSNGDPNAAIIGLRAKNNQKRIVLPVRVEPKVFFANERTFLSWLHFCITLGGLALALLNFGDRVGQVSGLVFTLVAMLFMLYALFLYLWRAHKIRTRDPGPYDDRFGPTILVFCLFFAVLLNFWLKFTNPHP